MKNLNLFRKSARGSEGSTLASAVVRPSFDRRLTVVKHLAFMLLFLLGSLNVWGEEITYTFNSKSWDATSGGSAANWTSGKDGAGFSNNGIQVTTNASGANGTSPISFTNVTKVVCTYNTNASKGKGTIDVQVGTNDAKSVNWAYSGSASGTSANFTAVVNYSTPETGNVKITLNTTTNSIYLVSVTITTQSSNPEVNVSPASWDFGTVHASAEASKVFSVSGSNLTAGNLTLTVPDGFSVDPSSIAVDGTLAATNVTVSKNTSTEDDYAGNLSITGGGLESEKTVDLTMTVDADPAPTGTFELYSGDITEGDYVICSGTTALKNELASNTNYIGYETVIVSENTITDPSDALIWHIAQSGEYWTIYNATADNYAASTGAKNKGQVIADGTDDKALWAASGTSSYEFVNKANTAASVNSNLRYNNGYGFACYGTGTGAALTLYKLSDGKEAAGLAYDDSDLSNLVKLGGTFTAPTLTNPHSLTVAYESSNTDVAEVASNGALTIKAVGVAEITASFAGDEDYKAGSAQYALYVVAHEGTEADPYTVADARVVIDKVGETGIADKYATGIVSKIVTAFNPTYGNITYDISSDGATESAQLRAFRGFDKDGAWFTSEDDVLVGDEVVVKGTLKKYLPSTYEFDEGNQLVSLNRTKAAAGLAYAETAIEKNIGDAAFTNTLTNPNSLDVTYSSTATGVATVDENGEVTIVGMGTTTIKATFAGNASYLADEVSYTLKVEDPSLIKVTFDATVDKGESPLSKSNITFSCSNGVLNNESEYRLYKNSTTTLACSVGNIAMIEFLGVSGNPASGFAAPTEGDFVTDGNNATWTGNAASISFEASGAQVRATKIFVSYREDTRVEAGLEYAETAVVKTVGDDAFINALTNPHSVAVTYESSDTDVAEVASDGTVTIKAQGSATISASFDGDATYKPASVSYELTVNEPGMDNVTFDATSDYTDEASTLTLSKGGFTLTFTNGALNNKENYRLYKNQTMTLSSTDYKIKKIEFTCDAGNPISGFADATGLDKEHNQWTGDASKVELTASNAQVRMTQLVVYYVEDTRAASGLAWSTDEVEITLGDPFTAANLVNPNGIDAAEITIESSNTDLATVTAGVVELVADAIGTATITATFEGNATYKPAEFSYTITVNDPNPVIYVQPSLNVNFGTVAPNASVEDKTITVTLTNVANATATLGGTNPEAFSIDKTALVNGDVITISVASTAAIGNYSATITISDDAEAATSKVVNLSLVVEDVETAVSTTSKWVAATDADLVDGAEVLITGVKDAVTYAMGADRGNNRFAVAGTLNEGVFTPGENTMSFTLVAQGDGTFAIRTSNGKYLYAGGTGNSNYLNTNAYAGELDANAKWNITISSIIATSTNRNDMRFNYNNNNPALISCYQSTSTNPAITLYVPKPAPEPVYEEVRSELTVGRHYTVCLPKNITHIKGATFWNLQYKNEGNTEVYLVEETAPEAGKPYIIQATADKLEVIYGEEIAANPVENGALRGTFTGINETDFAALEGTVYLLINNAIRPRTSGNYLDANRAYVRYDLLTVVTSMSMPGRRVKTMPMAPQVATGLENGELMNDAMVKKVLINGQLFILRGEKVYDAKGQLVK